MKKPALIIKELSIYKIPGFPTGMESIKSIARNINVIAGPNASGKSSTARIIQDVIWKQNIERIHVDTRLSINEEIWDIKIDNGHYSSQCNGMDDSLPSIPAFDESKRYFLALHELIREDDKNLAAEILRETIGGYDLQSAQQTLGFSSATATQGLNVYKNFEAKHKNVDEVEKKQRNLQKEEEKLSALKENLEEAKKASKLNQLYLYLIDFLKSEEEYKILEIEKDAYPEQMPRLIGNEYDELSKLEKNIEKINHEITGVNQRRYSKNAELKALPIPEGGFDKVILDELHENIDRLADLERNLEAKRVAITKNEGETNVVLSQLFSSLQTEDIEALDLENIQQLDDFFENAHSLLNKKNALENKIQLLSKEKQEHKNSEENLHIGIRVLLDWFEKDTGAKESSPQLLWVLLVIGVITVPLTYFLGWLGLLGVLAMLLVILRQRREERTDALRTTRESDFKKSGLTEPASWQEQEVSKRLEELHQELQQVKRQNEIRRQLTELHDSLEQIQPHLQELEATRQDWIHRLSNIPELTVENMESYSGLYWFLKNLQKWQKHNNELQANYLSFSKENEIYEDTLKRINSILDKVDIKAASDSASAKAILKSMNENESRRTVLNSEIESLKVRKVDFENQIERDQKGMDAVYKELKLDIGAESELLELLSKKEAYDEFAKEFEQARRRRIEKQNQLHNHALYLDVKDDLPTHIEEAEERNEQYAKSSNEAEELLSEIATIEAHIGKERMGHELEVALTEREAALDRLEQHYLTNIASISGDVIINGLKKKTQEHSNSKVFKRANELFNKITHGHYELVLDDREGGSFRAKDTILNQGLPLDHLSSGTRIQLLIAVRLAFIESQESGIKLPIIADEVLANSDDLRAKQIIEALVEISKEGRQVFYFTAQADELKKWQEYLSEEPEIDGKIIILKGVANAQIKYDLDDQSVLPSLEFANVLSPGTYSNEVYHKLLDPPQYNLLSQTSEQLYVSYLIEDNTLLHACLQRGIQYYGQLKSFVNFQGKIEGLDASILEEIGRKVELLDSYQELYQSGRPKPIDREVLLNSGSVSDTFIDIVAAKLKELDQNPEKLITSLRAREISGFMEKKIDELEDYLFANNFLNENLPLTEEELSIRTHAILSRMEIEPDEAERFLKRLVNFKVVANA